MNQGDKTEIIQRYRERLDKYGVDIRALSSGTEERRRLRFEVLASVGTLDGSSILDLGCGFADFYAYLKERNISVRYTGYDISPDLVRIAKQRFPDAEFETRDIQEAGVSGTFDFIICSQMLNHVLKHENNLSVMKDILSRCYSACNVAVAMDMLSSYVDFREEHLYYYQPEEIFTFCKTLTKRMTLRHEYPLFEFAVFLYKDFQGWSNSPSQ